MDKMDIALTPSVKLAAKILHCYKFLGFGSFTVVDGKSVTKFGDIFWLLLSLSLGGFICYLSITQKHVLGSSQSDIADHGNFLTLLMSIFIALMAMCCCFVFRHKIWWIVLSLGKIETKVSLY